MQVRKCLLVPGEGDEWTFRLTVLVHSRDEVIVARSEGEAEMVTFRVDYVRPGGVVEPTPTRCWCRNLRPYIAVRPGDIAKFIRWAANTPTTWLREPEKTLLAYAIQAGNIVMFPATLTGLATGGFPVAWPRRGLTSDGWLNLPVTIRRGRLLQVANIPVI